MIIVQYYLDNEFLIRWRAIKDEVVVADSPTTYASQEDALKAWGEFRVAVQNDNHIEVYVGRDIRGLKKFPNGARYAAPSSHRPR